MQPSYPSARQQDALLAGLGRLTTAPQPIRRAHHAEPFYPISRVDTLEVVEHATGLQRADADPAAAERLLRWVRRASLDSVDVLRAIVAGSTPNDARLNARVLAVVHWLCVEGGPVFLPDAVQRGTARKPGPGVRVCLDVLGSFGHVSDMDLLYDDNVVRRMRLEETGIPSDALTRCRVSSASVLGAAVETYAVALGRKLIFHSRHPDVEVNYSLDRFFRSLHQENKFDNRRERVNNERHSTVISRVALAEVALLARVFAVTSHRLNNAKAPVDIRMLVLGEAINAYSYAEYLRRKLAIAPMDDHDLTEQHGFLVRKLMEIEENEMERGLLSKYVDDIVLSTIQTRGYGSGGIRPESKHRTEIVCSYTSFQALHNAMAPMAFQQLRET